MELKFLFVFILFTIRGFVADTTNETETVSPLLPDRKYCGLESPNNIFHKSNLKIVNKFPWTALLSYQEDLTSGPHCSGSLIADRYVLIAASCISPPDLKGLYVTFGYYNINCTDAANSEGCTDGTRIYGVEKLILHPDYNILKKGNNIGLIRLNRKVIYSDFVRPVCLPFSNESPFPQLGEVMVASGWVRHSDRDIQVTIKENVSGHLVTKQECAKYYKGDLLNLLERDHFLCIAPLPNKIKYLCDWQTIGSPLMFLSEHRWQQEGMMLFERNCNSVSPDIYMNIRSYVPWIVENIKP